MVRASSQILSALQIWRSTNLYDYNNIANQVNKFVRNKMKRTYKMLQICSLSIQFDDLFKAKDISRVKLSLIDQNKSGKASEYKAKQTTKFYAEISKNLLFWNEIFELRYTGQAEINFQTFCQHQYGYDLNDLQVICKGVYYLKNEMFFKKDHTHVFNLNGEKCGILRLEIKIVNREQQQKLAEAVIEPPKPLVREDLIGLIRIYEIYLQITNPAFNKKKYQTCLELHVNFNGQSYKGQLLKPFIWKFEETKLQYIIGGAHMIQFELVCEGNIILEGAVSCEAFQEKKRYIKWRINIYNRNGIKIGCLITDYRFIEKKQLLDLLYSPTSKLSKIDTTKIQSKIEQNKKQLSELSESFFLKQSKDRIMTSRKSSSFLKNQQKSTPNSRYKVPFLMNTNSDVLIPKAARFEAVKNINHKISYIDPEKQSSFSPQSHKGPNITKGTKFDFTRQYKGNPGVGKYKLPSIWDKY